MMKLTAEGLALIKEFEGFRARAYKCPAGIWTIGYGHTSNAGPPAVHEGMVVSRDVADAILSNDVAVFASGIAKELKVELSGHQFSALVSFAYNVGLGNFRSSSVLRAVNAGDTAAVPRRLQLWIKAGGKVLPGLVRRRAAEAELFVGEGRVLDTPSGASITVPSGKPIGHSTTAGAAAAAVTAGTTAAVAAAKGGGTGWIAASLLILIIAAAGAWIIRERLRKSKEEGL